MADSFSITQELIRGGITFASVIAAAWVALRNHRSNQWWNARHSAYEKAIELLDRMSRPLFEYSYLVKKENAPTFPLSKLELIKAWGKCDDLHKEFQSLVSRSKFNVSSTALAVLEDTSDYMHQMLVSEEFFRKHQDTSAIPLYKALDKICEAAKHDLQILSFREKLSSAFKKSRGLFTRAGNIIFRKARLLVWIVWYGEEKGKRRAGESLKLELASH